MPTYTYDELLPTDKDRTRMRLGVTDVSGGATTALISDEHINAVLLDTGALSLAVMYLARELAVQFAQKPSDITLASGLRLAWRERVSRWMEIAELSQTTASASLSPAGGQLTATAPVMPPCPGAPDANDRLYRGDPYRRRWRP